MESEDKLRYMIAIPPMKGRIVAVDTETTGMSKEDHVVEIGAVEIVNGKVSGNQFHIYIKPRTIMSSNVINIHKIDNGFYESNCKMYYSSDRENLDNFLKFLKDSLIFCHNA